MNNAFGMIPKVPISVFSALNSKCHAESRQSLLLPLLKVEVNTVFTAQAPAAFQVSKNTAITSRQLPVNWKVWHHENLVRRCSVNTQSVTGFCSHTQQAVMDSRGCLLLWWDEHFDERRRKFATLTLSISDRSARPPLASYLTLAERLH